MDSSKVIHTHIYIYVYVYGNNEYVCGTFLISLVEHAKLSFLKVSISWLGILHIYNIWNPVIRIAIYLVVRKFYLRGLFGC